jgi:hypothetical protein
MTKNGRRPREHLSKTVLTSAAALLIWRRDTANFYCLGESTLCCASRPFPSFGMTEKGLTASVRTLTKPSRKRLPYTPLLMWEQSSQTTNTHLNPVYIVHRKYTLNNDLETEMGVTFTCSYIIVLKGEVVPCEQEPLLARVILASEMDQL